MTSTLLQTPQSARDHFDRNLLRRTYSAEGNRLTSELQAAERELNKRLLTTTYREEIINLNNHGCLVNHYGNYAYHPQVRKSCVNILYGTKPFQTPSYRNITQNVYLDDRNFKKNYLKNQRTSDDNVNFHLIEPSLLPHKTKIPSTYRISVKSLANADGAAIKNHDNFSGYANDLFYTKKYIKTEMENIRDMLASGMELADYLRNKSLNVHARSKFGHDSNKVNNIDLISNLLTQFISELKSLMRLIASLDLNAVDMKRMVKDLEIAERITESNLNDRNFKPEDQRNASSNTETALKLERTLLHQINDFTKKALSETQIVLNGMKSLVDNFVNNLLEEAKKIFMERLANDTYQRDHLRDQNGYLKVNQNTFARTIKSMSIDSWLKSAKDLLGQIRVANKNAEYLNQVISNLILQITNDTSKQYQNTHNVGVNQLENDLKHYGTLLAQKKNVNHELAELSHAIGDTKRKLGTCQYLNEFKLTKLEGLSPNKDFVNDKSRLNEIEHTNRIWSHANDLHQNYNSMLKYQEHLERNCALLDKELKSSAAGMHFDEKTIVNPRRHGLTVQPVTGLVSQVYSTFF